MEAPISSEPLRKPNLLNRLLKRLSPQSGTQQTQAGKPEVAKPTAEITPRGESRINRRISTYDLEDVPVSAGDAVLGGGMDKFLGTKYLIRADILDKAGNFGGFVDYAISDRYLFIYRIITEHARKPFGASFDALTELLKKAGNRKILTSPLTTEGKRMLEGLEKRGYIVTKPAPRDFSSLPNLQVAKENFPPVEIELKYKTSETKPAYPLKAEISRASPATINVTTAGS